MLGDMNSWKSQGRRPKSCEPWGSVVERWDCIPSNFNVLSSLFSSAREAHGDICCLCCLCNTVHPGNVRPEGATTSTLFDIICLGTARPDRFQVRVRFPAGAPVLLRYCKNHNAQIWSSRTCDILVSLSCDLYLRVLVSANAEVCDTTTS